MSNSNYIHNSHNVSNLVYHFVCPTKYRRIVITEDADECVKQTCAGIELRYDWIIFLEIGADKDQVHFLIQSKPNYSPSKIILTVKSITAKRVFAEHPEVKSNCGVVNFGATDILWQRSEKRGVKKRFANMYRIRVNKMNMNSFYSSFSHLGKYPAPASLKGLQEENAQWAF